MRARSLVVLLALVFLVWGLGLAWFVSHLDDPSPDPGTPVDAIVVLTGGTLRFDAGLQLLIAHKAKKMFVSGVHPGIDTAEMLRQTGKAPKWVRCCIVLGHAAYNTIGNAIESSAWIKAQNYHSIRLVTANYHMRRSLLEFRRVVPQDVKIIPYPVFPEGARQGTSWRWRGTVHVIVIEYMKYLGAVARVALLTWFPGLTPLFVPPGFAS